MKDDLNNTTKEIESTVITGSPDNSTGRYEEGGMQRGQFRQYLVNTRYKQIQTELLVSIVLGMAICAVLWASTPLWVLFLWSVSTMLMVGIRSLFVYNSDDTGNAEDVIACGDSYAYVVALSGMCWGSLGIIGELYGGVETHQLTMLVIACISVTAFISMQSSPRIVTAFMVPALIPNGLWFLMQDDSTMRSLGIIALVTFWLMQTSSSGMRDVLVKSLNLSTHNTELIHKLVAARESADKATIYAKKTNIKLQNEFRERLRAEEQIKEANRELAAILDNMQDTVFQTDEDGKILWTTPSVKEILGFSGKEVLDRNIKDFHYDENDYHRFRQELHANKGVLNNFVARLVKKSGTTAWISVNCHYKYNDERELTGLEGSVRDITGLREAQDALFAEKENAQVILASIVDGVIRTDVHGIIEYMNETAEKGVGLKLKDCIGRRLLEVFNIVDEKTLKTPPDPSKTSVEEGKSIILPGYLQLIHSFHNERLSVEVIASPIRDSSSDITGVVIVFHDVTESRSLSKMTYQATHDSLTGLINRREFERRVKQAMDNARSKDERYALCYMDLDNFKLVNDTCGHNAGDELLKQLSSKLLTAVRESDSLARLGGDEFGILLSGCSIESAHKLAEQIRVLVEGYRFVWNNQGFRIGVSVGLVNVNVDSGTISDILSAADSACYVAKESGGNRVHKYENDDSELLRRRGQMQWVQKIHTVLEENRFRLFFQRIDKLSKAARSNDKIHGEVLLRMLDEDNRLIGPGSFIPAAERYNLMPAIDRWVVENTFRFLTRNMDKLYNRLDKCCINLSGQSLSDERFLDFIVEQIENSIIPPAMLCFEITETAVIANMKIASDMMAKLRKMGCHFALDDFGVGLSSFAYLSNLAVDYLKVDGSFVRNMRSSKTDLEMVRAINQIGHTVNVLTIAEFVEDAETLGLIRDLGIDYAQGYAASKPCPIEVALLNEKDECGADGHQEEDVSRQKLFTGKA